MSDREMTEFLAGVVGVVDASSFERQCLWQEHPRKEAWKQRTDGLLENVGKFADMPVCISLNTAEIDGHKILFIEPTSQVVDHRLIEKWLQENMPRSAFTEAAPVHINRTDAQNFHIVFQRAAKAA